MVLVSLMLLAVVMLNHQQIQRTLNRDLILSLGDTFEPRLPSKRGGRWLIFEWKSAYFEKKSLSRVGRFMWTV